MTFWTLGHAQTMLPVILIGLVLAIVLRLLIGRAKLWIRMIPLQLLSLLLVAMEIQKQITGQEIGYDPVYLPFHFCSLFLILLPLASFYFGKGAEVIRSLTFILTTTVTVVTLVAPGGVVGTRHIEAVQESYLSLHSILFHCIIPVAFFLILALDLARPRLRRDLIITFILVLCYCIFARKMSLHFDANYSNFNTCDLDVFEEHRLSLIEKLGEVKTAGIYVFCVALAHLLGNALGCVIATGLAKLTRVREKKPAPVAQPEASEPVSELASAEENTPTEEQKTIDV